MINFHTRSIKGIKPSEAVKNIRASMRKHMHPTTSKIIQAAKKKAIQGSGGTASLLSAKLDELIELGDDPRPRNSLGMFADQQEGVADPNSMVKVYKSRGVGAPLGLLGAGAVTGAGIATGSAGARAVMTKTGSGIQKAASALRRSKLYKQVLG